MTIEIKGKYCSICKKTEKELKVPLIKAYKSKYGKIYLHCRDCNTEKCRKYRERNREKVRAKAKEYQEKNKEKLRAYGRDYYHKNKNK